MSPTIVALGLATARIWALLRVQASWRRAVGPSWPAIAAGLALVVALVAVLGGRLTLRSHWSVAELLVAAVFELLLGSVLGLLASLPGWALIGAAELSEQQLLPGSSEPGTSESGTLARMLLLASLAAGLGLGLHRVALAAMLASFEHLSLATPQSWWAALEPLGPQLAGQALALTSLALALATPVLLTSLLASLAMACLMRSSLGPQLLAEVLAPALRLVGALLALAAAWSTYTAAFAQGLG